MLAIAKYSLKGRPQAALVLTVCAILTWIFPFATCVSTGILLLIALRQSYKEIFVVVAISVLAVFAFAGATHGKYLETAFILIVLWVPALASAFVLSRTRALPLAIVLNAAFGSVIVIAMFLVFADPAALWIDKLQALLTQSALQTKFGLSDEETGNLAQNMARMMTGALATGVSLNGILGLLLASWWHGRLSSTSHFQAMFHQLRLGKSVAMVTLLIYALALLTGLDWLASLMMVWTAIFIFQGLAVAHSVVLKKGWHVAWLVGLYATIFILPLVAMYILMMLAVVGLSDSWLNLRERL